MLVVEPSEVPTALLDFYYTGCSKFAGSIIRIVLATNGQSSCYIIFCNESKGIAVSPNPFKDFMTIPNAYY